LDSLHFGFDVVDTAHGHSQGVLDRVQWVKKNFPQIEVIGGNIATGAAALALVEAGADGAESGARRRDQAVVVSQRTVRGAVSVRGAAGGEGSEVPVLP
jgi:hypothetical protein